MILLNSQGKYAYIIWNVEKFENIKNKELAHWDLFQNVSLFSPHKFRNIVSTKYEILQLAS